MVFCGGVAQVVFQLSIAAPLFWAGRDIADREAPRATALARVCAPISSAPALGLLQVYYPETFLPPEFSSLSLRLNPRSFRG